MWNAIKGFCRAYPWRIALSTAGVLLAVLMLCIGFFRTLLLVVLGGAGFFAGLRLDDADAFTRLMEKVIPERFRR